MPSQQVRQKNFERNTRLIEAFCDEFQIKYVKLNNGYQIRLEGMIDLYPVRSRWHNIKTGKRGDWHHSKDLRFIMLGAVEVLAKETKPMSANIREGYEGNVARSVREVVVPEHPMPRPSLKMMDLPIPNNEQILRIETFRDPSPRRFKWQVWRPKYGVMHYLALTEKGVYDVTLAVEEQVHNV